MAEELRAEGPIHHDEPGVLRTLAVAFAVCAVCSAVVVTAVVLLRPYELENQRQERAAKVAALVEGLPGVGDLATAGPAGGLEAQVVELASGDYAPEVDIEALLGASDRPPNCRPLAPERDVAGIGCVPRHAPVYELRREGRVHTAILPVYGQGYLSTMRGYLAVAGDGETVRGITFTSHEETPGLGSEITNPQWQAQWKGKQLYGEGGAVRIRVVQDPPPSGSEAARHTVQGISGATKTSQGVSELVRFWVGPEGFGPYLDRIGDTGGGP